MKPIVFALLFIASMAQAGGKTSGLVTLVETKAIGVVLYTMSGTPTGQPDCATKGRYAVDLSTQAGKNHSEWLGKAYVLGRSVTVVGAGTCTAGGENVLETTIQP